MDTKLSAVRAAMDAGDWTTAIRLAARFPRLGAHREAILDAHTAITNPRWTLGLRRDPAADIEAGRLALMDRYGAKGATG